MSFNRAATSGFGPRTEIEPIEDSELSSKHARESAAILACIIVFNELESEEMNEMLSWLGGLAWDGLAGELFSLVAPFVVNAAREPSAWQFLERDLPESCRLIELIDAKSICS
ncbi:MAG TPA: hypothetical protein VLV54_18930 [Thermoanaerobaculia bacterium]|nr:hypothetical protein [Thermoanaerobaculia bacterium]